MPPESERGDGGAPEEALAPYRIEAARSSRSRCRTCRRKIEKDTLRLGVLLEGPYGTGYLWHHLKCAARRRFEDVEAAYEARAWDEGVEVPPLERMRALGDAAEKERSEKRELPYAERAPTGRSRCKHCGEPIAKGAWRVAVGRIVEFYGQTRTGPANVHAHCVSEELASEECATDAEGFADAIEANSRGLDAGEVRSALAAIGPIEIGDRSDGSAS